MKNRLHNINIRTISPLPTPTEMKLAYPLTDAAYTIVAAARKEIAKIILGNDPRLLIVVGPCSIHHSGETLEYARRLAVLAEELKDQLLLVMRFCGDKPRTGKAWTGFWNDPYMNGSCDIAYGWSESRKLAIKILDLGLPLGCEFLDAENFQRLDDIPSYVWLGARDVGSQRQRQVASGISTPVGFKNHNVGGVNIALEAMGVALRANVFVASDDDGRSSRFETKGNALCHLIHRGTEKGPNYDEASIAYSVEKLKSRDFIPRLVIDSSHANSNKDHRKQAIVIHDVIGQVISGIDVIAGLMYESYLENGNQPFPKNRSELLPGISVTDGCDGWERTEKVLREAHYRLSRR